jgi:hypothetical protein
VSPAQRYDRTIRASSAEFLRIHAAFYAACLDRCVYPEEVLISVFDPAEQALLADHVSCQDARHRRFTDEELELRALQYNSRMVFDFLADNEFVAFSGHPQSLKLALRWFGFPTGPLRDLSKEATGQFMAHPGGMNGEWASEWERVAAFILTKEGKWGGVSFPSVSRYPLTTPHSRGRQ